MGHNIEAWSHSGRDIYRGVMRNNREQIIAQV